MKLCTVITTINPPTDAVHAWIEKGQGDLIVVGDQKTTGWAHGMLENVTYLAPGDGDDTVARFLPANHYCQKNLGYVEAVRQGATVINDTDDDNAPNDWWKIPGFGGQFDRTSGRQEFVNAYRFFTHFMVWPRGLPLEHVLPPFDSSIVTGETMKVGVWQGLADEDPDVDAIFRLTRGGRIHFERRAPVVIAQGSICPFNSQNTLVCQELFPLLYLPAVSFRFTDILRGLVAQPIMWAMGYHLGFTEATVIQKRNPHDLMADFESELPVYRYAAKIPGIVKAAISDKSGICANLWEAYTALHKAGIVEKGELTRLWMWLKVFE